jgi:hypothetical protein
MTKLFGFADIISSLLFVANFYKIDLPKGFVLAVGIFLAIKGVIFIVNFFSWIDIATGLMLIFGWASAVHPFVLLGIALFLGIKGIVSLFTF